MSFDTDRAALLAKLKEKSVFFGDFVLSSGGRSSFYIDCRLTTLDPQGACLVGKVLNAMIQREIAETGAQVKAVGGLTMGADPVALAIGMTSWMEQSPALLQVFSVRKAPKAHGQTKLIEGNFSPGDSVVVLDDVVTRGDSTLRAIESVEQAGGKVAFVAVLVDRGEGGGDKIRALGHRMLAAFQRVELTGDISARA
ncbi:MAG TPA: orotate phosphoribosyltransferase [Chthoniobacteraceae bacterium]|jgi:orotate phosphoribosyltransferase|nr:orotate phosphoribosyltransferase [Chthoniobacteraceae bacterium]